MNNYLVMVHDAGQDYKITGTRQQPVNEMVDELLFKYVSLEDFCTIEEKLKTNTITVAKTSRSKITKDDLKMIQLDSILAIKESCFTLCREALRNRLGVELLFDFFDYTNINNGFLSKGFNIIRDQEDTFFDIISSDDDSLKEKLGEYLELYDKISMHRNYFDKYEAAKKAIQKATTKEEAEKERDIFTAILI